MLKIFNTQLNGVFQSIQKEEQSIEDSARLLAQTVLSSGRIFFKGFEEMQAIVMEGIYGENTLSGSCLLPADNDEEDAFTSVDSAVVSARFLDHPELLSAGKRLKEKGVSVVAIGAKPKDTDDSLLLESYDVWLDTKVKHGLVPQEDGSRAGFPSSISGLYVYLALYLTVKEIVEEFMEE